MARVGVTVMLTLVSTPLLLNIDCDVAIQKRQRRRLRRGDYEVHNGNDGNDGNDGKGVGSQDGKIRFR